QGGEREDHGGFEDCCELIHASTSVSLEARSELSEQWGKLSAGLAHLDEPPEFRRKEPLVVQSLRKALTALDAGRTFVQKLAQRSLTHGGSEDSQRLDERDAVLQQLGEGASAA